MEELLNKIFESEVLAPEVAARLKKQIGDALAEAKKKGEDAGRADVNARYRDDRARTVEALDRMVTEGISKEIKEFRADRNNLARLQAKMAKAISEADSRATKRAKAAVTAMGAMIDRNLDGELREWRTDVVQSRKASVKALREQQADAERMRNQFIKRGAVVLEALIERNLRKTLTTFHKEIKESKQKAFGSKIFEAFVAEFQSTFFNKDAFARSLTKKLADAGKAVTEAKKAAAAADERAAKAEKSQRQLAEQAARSRKVGSLLATVGDPAARKQMGVLLEGVHVNDLEKSFKKFLPEVIGRGGRRLTESVQRAAKPAPEIGFRNGNRPDETGGDAGDDKSLARLKVVAGIAKR